MRQFRKQGRNDEGAYAILYAILVVVLVGMGAIVVDLSQVRADRRVDRSAADSAVLGGVQKLNTLETNASPYEACRAAWRHIATTLGVSVPAGACGNFAAYNNTAAVTAYCSAAAAPWPQEIADDRTISGDRAVRVAWPIPYHTPGGPISAFLTPELAPGGATQNFDPVVDGSANGCDRLGVAVFEDESFGLGSVFGIGGTRTQVHSVARVTINPGEGEFFYPLVVLDPTGCTVLSTGGTNNSILVRNGASPTYGNVPGRVAVDSDASSCKSNQYLTQVSGGGFIQTMDGADAATNPADQSAIEYYNATKATKPTSSGGPSVPCTPTDSAVVGNAPCTGRTRSRPKPVTRQPFDAAFGAAISRLDSELSPVTSTTGGWTPVTGATCNQPYAPTTGTNFIVQCSGALTKQWAFPAGSTVIWKGNLTLASSASEEGCLLTNYDSSWGTVDELCKGLKTLPASSTYTTSSVLRVEGRVDANGSGSLLLPGTLVHLPGTGSSRYVDGTSFTRLIWTAPFYDDKDAAKADCTASLAAPGMPSPKCFRNLALWSDNTATNTMQGGSVLFLEGTFFSGVAPVKVGGNGSVSVTKSQFIAWTLTTAGSKTLEFVPDPVRTTPVPTFGVALIR
jgi:Flp pilus assembly protein TadG